MSAVAKGLAVYETAVPDEFDDPWERPAPRAERRPARRERPLRVIAAGVCARCGFVHPGGEACGWREPWSSDGP